MGTIVTAENFNEFTNALGKPVAEKKCEDTEKADNNSIFLKDSDYSNMTVSEADKYLKDSKFYRSGFTFLSVCSFGLTVATILTFLTGKNLGSKPIKIASGIAAGCAAATGGVSTTLALKYNQQVNKLKELINRQDLESAVA